MLRERKESRKSVVHREFTGRNVIYNSCVSPLFVLRHDFNECPTPIPRPSFRLVVNETSDQSRSFLRRWSCVFSLYFTAFVSRSRRTPLLSLSIHSVVGPLSSLCLSTDVRLSTPFDAVNLPCPHRSRVLHRTLYNLLRSPPVLDLDFSGVCGSIHQNCNRASVVLGIFPKFIFSMY